MQDNSDRRVSTRKRAVLEVTYHDPPDAKPDFVTNLTEHGVYIATNQPFLIDQKVSLRINATKPIDLRGVVRWRQTATAESEGGIGVEFEFDDSDGAEKVRAHLRRLVKRLRPA